MDEIYLDASLIEYETVMFENLLEDYNLELFINESVMLASNIIDYKLFKSLHEETKEKQKNIFARLLENISKLWHKFIEVTTKLLTTNDNYLDKYKDTIINVPLKEDEYVMYPYWLGKPYLIRTKVPAFNYNMLRDSLQSEEKFMNSHFGNFVDKEIGFIDRVKQLLRGDYSEEIKIKSKDINMEELFSFCKDFKNLRKIIETDMKEIQAAGNKAIDIISSMKTTDTDAVTGESVIYSLLKEQIYIQEVKKVSNMDTADGQPADSATMKSNIRGTEDTDTKNIKDAVKEKEDDLERVKLYIRVCYNFLGAKMSIVQEMYKAYMYIIRDHVKMNLRRSQTIEEPEDENVAPVRRKETKTPETILNKFKNFMIKK